MTATRHASLLFDATPHQVRDVLLDALSLPEWNPAFLSMAGPSRVTLDAEYQLVVRPGLTGRLVYRAVDPCRVQMAWHVPGFAEVGTWHLAASRERTLVRHDFTHAGPLAAALGRAYRGVAELRLERLEQRLAR